MTEIVPERDTGRVQLNTKPDIQYKCNEVSHPSSRWLEVFDFVAQTWPHSALLAP